MRFIYWSVFIWSASLIPLIKKNVADGSVIMTDCWPSYNSLTANGYIHLTVNHSINFVDQRTLANTQKIECSWRHMKTALTKGSKNYDFMTQYLCEFLWRRHYRRKGVDLFIQFIHDISELYKVWLFFRFSIFNTLRTRNEYFSNSIKFYPIFEYWYFCKYFMHWFELLFITL